MPRAKKVAVKTPNLDVQGPTPVIEIPNTITGNSELDKKLIRLPEDTNKEALETALLLQQLIRGQNSLLENQRTQGEELQKIRAKMAAMDEATAKYEADKDAYIADVMNRAERDMPTGDRKAKIIAKGVASFQEEMVNQKANLATEKLKFEDELARMPKVTVTSPGKIENIMQNGMATPTLVGEEIRIKHKVWYLHPGVPTEVPQIVATALAERRRIEAENDMRSQAMQKNLENNKLIEELRKIDKKFGVQAEE